MPAKIDLLRFKQLDSRAVLPQRGSALAAGLDICSIEELAIEPKQRAVARTGLAVAIPPGFYGRIAPRSGLAAKNGLDVLAGVIDSDYRGEVCCLLYNTGNETIKLPAGSKICQLIVEQIITPEAAWAADLMKRLAAPAALDPPVNTQGIQKHVKSQSFKKYLALVLSILTVASTTFGWAQTAAPATAPVLSATERQLAESINVDTIKEAVNALAADEMQGRGTGQPGGDKAAAYLADRFAKLGLKPLGNNNLYLQPIKFRELQLLPQTSFTVGNESLKLGPDYFVMPPNSGDENVNGKLMFVAYGISFPFLKRNDLQGVDVRGKVLVMRQGPPPEISKDQWKKAQAQVNVMRGLIAKGAAALVLIHEDTADQSYAEVADYLTRRQIEPEAEQEVPDFLPPFISISERAAEKLFAASGVTVGDALAKARRDDFAPIDLKQSATITVRFKKSKGTGNNVIGLLEGSDPKLKSEALVYSAHYDAYGVGADNRIYHGAADNALGVAEMLAVAESIMRATTKPRRSIIFLAVTGEEYGGYGSDYWVKNPTWKIKQVAADLNLDGMGTEVYGPVKVLVGYGVEHSSLGSLLNDVAVASGLRMIPDPMPEEKAFYRSDHYFFVKKGVPGLMILGAPDGATDAWTDRLKKWTKTDYHQPSDVVRPDWDWSGPRTIAQVMLVMGLRVANDESMPAWLPSSIFNRERDTDKPAPPEP